MEVERVIQNIELSELQLFDLVRKAFPNAQKLDGWKILSGGASNTTYKIKIKSGIFVLRIYTRDRKYCATEKAIHQLICKSVSTPQLIYADENHEPWAYSFFEFVSGCHLDKVPNQEKDVLSYQLGHLLASIHAFKLQRAGLFGNDITITHHFELGSSPYFEETHSVLKNGKNIRSRFGKKLTDQAISFIEENKDFFPVINHDNICLTHSDFKPVNLVYANGKVTVLDWEFAHAGIGILDFAILLRYHRQIPIDLNILENSYIHFGGNLPKHWLRSAFITDFVNIVTMIDSPIERPKLFKQLKNAIEATILNWDLVEFLK